MKKDNLAYLRLILDAAQKVERYISSMDLSSFSADQKTQSAVIMQLHVIGEMAKRVPDDMKQEIDILWKKMAGMRDMISHEYIDLELETIWKTAKNDVPVIEMRIGEYLKNR